MIKLFFLYFSAFISSMAFATENSNSEFYKYEYIRMLALLNQNKSSLFISEKMNYQGQSNASELTATDLKYKFEKECDLKSSSYANLKMNQIKKSTTNSINGHRHESISFHCTSEWRSIKTESVYWALIDLDDPNISNKLVQLSFGSVSFFDQTQTVIDNNLLKPDSSTIFYMNEKPILFKLAIGTLLGAVATDLSFSEKDKFKLGAFNDKVVHSIIGSILSSAIFTFSDHILHLCRTKAAYSGLISALIFSLLKEFRDKVSKTGQPDIKDALAGGIGGAGISLVFNIQVPIIDDPNHYNLVDEQRNCK